MSRTASRYPDPTASTQADTEATQPGASVSLLRAIAGRSACSSPSGRRLDWIPDREKPVVPEEIAAICSAARCSRPACNGLLSRTSPAIGAARPLPSGSGSSVE